MSCSREEIIRDVARTLFVCAWADGVEAGEIEGEGPGAGGDWMDAAPRTWRYSLERRGPNPADYGSTGFDSFAAAEGAFRAAGGRVVREGVLPRRAELGQGRYVELRRAEVPDPDALAEARRIVDAFDAAGTIPYDQGAPYPDGEAPIEIAARIHAELSGTDRFAHCLAMTALGHGVGLEDDLPAGVALPGWIRASVPSSEFGAWDLDPARYPAPAGRVLEELRAGCEGMRGHALEWSPVESGGEGRLLQVGTCERCGREVQLDTRPPANGVDVGGEACAVGCEPGGAP